MCGQFGDGQGVRVLDHRHEQSPWSIHGHADVDVLLVDQLFAVEVDARVEAGKFIQGLSVYFCENGGYGEFAAALGHFFLRFG